MLLRPFPSKGVVRLNVGGKIFLTNVETVASQCTYFQNLATSDSTAALFIVDARGGSFFIDRDPAPFRQLLSFCRTGIIGAGMVEGDRILLRSEAEFYGCEQLREAMQAMSGYT